MSEHFSHAVIDSDCHVFEPSDLWSSRFPEELRDRAPRFSTDPELSMIVDIDDELPPRKHVREQDDRRKENVKSERYQTLKNLGASGPMHLTAMDEEGIDISVCFPSLGLRVMGAGKSDPLITTTAARIYNDWLGEFCSADARRLFGAGMIDPRDVNGAIVEAKRCVSEFGFPAVFLRPNPVLGRSWFDPAYEPLWTALENLDLAVCFHEGSSVSLPQAGTDRFDSHAFYHTVSHPFEQMSAMLAVVVGGVAARHPALRFAFLESGAGWLPYWKWRLDEAVEVEGKDFPALTLDPSEYVVRQCFVSIDTDEIPGIGALESFGGSHHVVWGSDFPHPDAKYPHAVKTLSTLPGMSPANFRSVVYEAPQVLFGAPIIAALTALET
jgi:predicted TIM-barrel fold metal-dependent hydrolase